MSTLMKTILKNSETPGAIEEAAEILQQGGLVAFPTETVYGLGGNALDPSASMRIYAAKGRPSDNPLIVHIAEKSDVWELAAEVPETAIMLMEAFWPGPLTIILRKKNIVPDETTGGLSTVAIRMPSHPAAMEMIRKSGIYVAAPSANRSGRPSPTTARHVEEDLDGRIEMILDGGPVGIGIESTIVDLTGDTPMILRPGFITREMLQAVIGNVLLDPSLIHLDEESTGDSGADGDGSDRDNGADKVNSVTGDTMSQETDSSFSEGPAPDLEMQHPKAPGMRYTHYAPKGTLSIVTDRNHPEQVTPAVTGRIFELAKKALEEGRETAVLTAGDTAEVYSELSAYPHFHLISLGDTDDGQTIAAHLYGALRTCDEEACTVIYSESFRRDALGSAIMNRLVKAAGHRILAV